MIDGSALFSHSSILIILFVLGISSAVAFFKRKVLYTLIISFFPAYVLLTTLPADLNTTLTETVIVGYPLAFLIAYGVTFFLLRGVLEECIDEEKSTISQSLALGLALTLLFIVSLTHIYTLFSNSVFVSEEVIPTFIFDPSYTLYELLLALSLVYYAQY